MARALAGLAQGSVVLVDQDALFLQQGLLNGIKPHPTGRRTHQPASDVTETSG
jgi:hypothetical protein